jgi:hypothetical protein
MATLILNNLDFNSQSRISNLLDAVSAQEPATLAQLNALVQGLAWKDNARVASQANVNLASPGATLDSITMAASDRVLIRSQTTGSENGIYLWNGAAVAMTRAVDADTANELESAVITVDEGTSAGVTYRQTTVNFTLGSGTVTWVTFGTAAPTATDTVAGIIEIATQAETDTGTDYTRAVTPLTLASYANRAKRYATSIGDGASTLYTVTHNLGTLDCIVQVFLNSTGASVLVDQVRNSTNAVQITFAVAPASNAYRVVVVA